MLLARPGGEVERRIPSLKVLTQAANWRAGRRDLAGKSPLRINEFVSRPIYKYGQVIDPEVGRTTHEGVFGSFLARAFRRDGH